MPMPPIGSTKAMPPEQNRTNVSHFTQARAGLTYESGMTRKTYQPSFDPQGDIATDYALIAIGFGAALVALIYLILI
jgi:hypothetical protein